MKHCVVFVAGGSGTRMQSALPKQFLELEGKPVLVHAILRFREYNPDMRMILVLPEAYFETWEKIKLRFPELQPVLSALGGKNRIDSVKNGLKLVDEEGLVAIHDAVRPFVSLETISRCFIQAEETGSAIPVVDIEDSLRLITADKSKILDRNMVKRVQTPQVFNTRKLKEAYNSITGTDFTDDASVYEARFNKVDLVEGNRENIKITYPGDL